MDTTFWVIIVILALLVVGIILAVAFSRRQHAYELQDRFGKEYVHTVETLGDEKLAQAELEERKKHVDALDIRPLTPVERQRYLEDRAAVQARFVDQPGQAIMDADRLIMEVMTLRAYPVADFEQRAADLSVNYPALVTNYRDARAIALKNKEGLATTEEMRQAMIYYRSLFEELLETQTVVDKEK